MTDDNRKDLVARLAPLASDTRIIDMETILRLQILGGDDTSFVSSLFEMFEKVAPLVIVEMGGENWDDGEKIKSLAHKLKGLSQNIGLDRLSSLASEVERSARIENLSLSKGEVISLLRCGLTESIDHIKSINLCKKVA